MTKGYMMSDKKPRRLEVHFVHYKLETLKKVILLMGGKPVGWKIYEIHGKLVESYPWSQTEFKIKVELSVKID